ncbi:MAG: GNAT family acetyltransferase [Acidiferrobacteraceae bacterium]|nr:GNAT family acetyltransferase [Acidiferrobacteraceae bacterium]
MTTASPTRVQIRAFELPDQERLLQLWHDCDLTRPWNNPEDDIRQCLENPSSELLVAVTEDTLCGSVMIGCDGHRGWVYYLAVDRQCRHQGIGRALMEHAEHWMRVRKVPKIQAMIRHDNLVVRGFYGRLNYRDGDVQLVQKWLNEETS